MEGYWNGLHGARKILANSPDLVHKPSHMDAEIRNAQGEKLDYAYHSAQGDCPFTVIIGHGVTANMNRPFVEALA